MRARVFTSGKLGEKSMTRLAWSPALAIVILGGIAASDSACTLVVGGDDGGNPFTDDSGSVQDTSMAADMGAQVDTGTQQDTGTQPDVGTQPDAGAAGEGGTCAVPADTGSAVCDQCIDAMCCTQSIACATPDDAGVDDAGASTCAQLAQCVVSWVAGGAGDIASGEAACGPTYTPSAQSASHALLTCIHDKCSCI
jgi:hypothetical protein